MGRDLESVERILREQWDPIGLGDIIDPGDEYDSYALGVLQLLHLGATEQDLAAHLRKIATEWMGLAATGQEHEVAARALLALVTR